jgi:hypothetical protein
VDASQQQGISLVKVRHFILVAFAALAGAAILPAPAAADGALATGPQQRFGAGFNYRTPREARNRALEQCGGGCSIVTMFRHACAAYAADRSRGSSIFGWAEAPSASRAERRALENCEEYGGRNCRATVYCDE